MGLSHLQYSVKLCGHGGNRKDIVGVGGEISMTQRQYLVILAIMAHCTGLGLSVKYILTNKVKDDLVDINEMLILN